MKYLSLLLAVPLLACQPSEPLSETDPVNEAHAATPSEQSVTPKGDVVKEGVVRLVLQTPVSEPRACILPIKIENGLEADVSVTMIGFSLTGAGEDTRGNMFGPVAKPGEASEARVIVEGQSCDAYDQVIASDIVCRSNETDCSDVVRLESSGGLRFVPPQ